MVNFDDLLLITLRVVKRGARKFSLESQLVNV